MGTCESSSLIIGNEINVHRLHPNVWTVSFGPVDGDPSQRRSYRNPIAAARAMISREHNAEDD